MDFQKLTPGTGIQLRIRRMGRLPAMSAILAMLVLSTLPLTGGAQPCELPDNGSGTVNLPPEGCEYLSPDEVHQIIDGLPPGTTIELDPIHSRFINIGRIPGGSSAGADSLGRARGSRIRRARCRFLE